MVKNVNQLDRNTMEIHGRSAIKLIHNSLYINVFLEF